MKKMFIILFLMLILSTALVAADHDDYDREDDDDDDRGDYSYSSQSSDDDDDDDYDREYDYDYDDDEDDESWDLSEDFVVVEEPVILEPVVLEPVDLPPLDTVVFETIATNYSDFLNTTDNMSAFNDLYLSIVGHLINDTSVVPTIDDYNAYLKQKQNYLQTINGVNSTDINKTVSPVSSAKPVNQSFFGRFLGFFGF